jgi:putative oxidoreductase
MAAHGAQKAFGWFEGPGPEGAAQFMHSLGFRPAQTYAPLAAWNEIVSGSLIALGLGGPIGPSMLISGMVVAAASVHAPNGFFAQKNGIEVSFIYSAAALSFAATDFGALSLDAVFGTGKAMRHPVFTTLTLAGGIAAAIFVLNTRDQSTDGPATPTFRGKNSPLPEEQTAAG